jgi:phosphoglycolate phosphatase
MSQDPTLSMPEAVIFDWDSTLADNWGAIGRSINATLSEYGHATWNETELRQRTKGSARDSFPKIFGARWEDAMAFFYARFEEFHITEVTPLPGAVALLQAINAENIPVSLVSNKTGIYLRAEVEALGWNDFFHNVIGAADAERDKPAPDPVFLALDGTNVDAGPSVWFVGDAVPDLECAHRASCVPILIHGGSITPRELEEWPPFADFASREALHKAFMNCAMA